MGDRGRREPRRAAPPAAAAAMRWTRRSVAHRPHKRVMHSINNQRRAHKQQARTATRAGALQAPKPDDSRQLCTGSIVATHRRGAHHGADREAPRRCPASAQPQAPGQGLGQNHVSVDLTPCISAEPAVRERGSSARVAPRQHLPSPFASPRKLPVGPQAAMRLQHVVAQLAAGRTNVEGIRRVVQVWHLARETEARG